MVGNHLEWETLARLVDNGNTRLSAEELLHLGTCDECTADYLEAVSTMREWHSAEPHVAPLGRVRRSLAPLGCLAVAASLADPLRVGRDRVGGDHLRHLRPLDGACRAGAESFLSGLPHGPAGGSARPGGGQHRVSHRQPGPGPRPSAQGARPAGCSRWSPGTRSAGRQRTGQALWGSVADRPSPAGRDRDRK